MDKVDRFGMILIGFLIGAFLFSGMAVTDEVVVEKEVIKEVPIEVIVEKETIKEVPVEVIVEKEVIKEVPIVPAEVGQKYKPGSYKVGRDIPAGEYKCEKIRGSGFDDWVIVSIASDANFDNCIRYDIEHNTALFSCENGDYVKIEYANFYLIEKSP
jgi:hypothetical protein